MTKPLPSPNPTLQYCVVVPVKDEEDSLPALVFALASQCTVDGLPLNPSLYEVILLLNNCTDSSLAVAETLRRQHPQLCMHSVEVNLPSAEAHVGRARQILFDLAMARFSELRRPGGIILTTDADTLPAPDWIAQTAREISTGVDGVGGRITLPRTDLARLPEGVRRLFLLDIGYRYALEEMRSHYAPEGHDPFPRHHQHFGGSLAVTAGACAAAGGIPLARSSEDVALYRGVLASGGKFRHSYRVRAITSARFIGRATGGLSDALNWWDRQCRLHSEVRVEGALAAERRLATLGHHCRTCPGEPPPWSLLATPEFPPLGEEEPLQVTLSALRVRNAILRHMTLEERLAGASLDAEVLLP